MVVTILYEGVALVKGVPAQERAEGLFVSCPFPMPVGTLLTVEHGGESARAARVARVTEGKESGGMELTWTNEVRVVLETQATEGLVQPSGEENGHPEPGSQTGRAGRRKKRRGGRQRRATARSRFRA